ncbi:MAG: IS4 family transposase [Sphingomonas bacterium]|nr:IS4 family transposase [Sphingomonas bacterium]
MISPQPSHDLVGRIMALLRWDQRSLARVDEHAHQGPRRKIERWQIIVAMVAHALPFAGRFSQCVRQCFGMKISDSALSQRRARLGADLFLLIMQEALRPLADPQLHPGCFFAGLRLVGIDGTRWSVCNTPQHRARITKAKTRRGDAAFAKINMSALVELGTHAPLAATLGIDAQSEHVLSLPLLAALPEESLLILDRLYGQAPMLEQLQSHCQQGKGQHFLTRVRGKLAVKIIETRAEGSALVEVALRDKIKKRLVLKTLRVREVRGRVWHRAAKKWIEVRLWTSLGVEQANARELLALYARRWEQEVFYRELKLQVAGGELLQSHTPESAQQEIAALLMAGSLLAEERLAVAAQVGGEVEAAGAVRISLSICMELMQALWLVLGSSQGLMNEAAQRELVRRMRVQIAACALPPRRARSCQRKVRQPVNKWPRMITPSSLESPSLYDVTIIA